MPNIKKCKIISLKVTQVYILNGYIQNEIKKVKKSLVGATNL